MSQAAAAAAADTPAAAAAAASSDSSPRMLLITGPNASGKSVYMKQVTCAGLSLFLFTDISTPLPRCNQTLLPRQLYDESFPWQHRQVWCTHTSRQ
jgi:hypothetical protein